MDREKLAAAILGTLPFVFKRLMKDVSVPGITHQQLGLLFMVFRHGGMPMSYYSDRMMISRPNLTVLADRMIGEGLLERKLDPHDRRIISLAITEQGKRVLSGHRHSAVQELARKLEILDDGEAERLHDLLTEVKKLFDKVEPTRTERFDADPEPGTERGTIC